MKKNKIFDSHTHLQSMAFDKDREEIIKKMADKDMGAIVVGTNLETSKKGLKLAEQNDNLFASIGLHPDYIESKKDIDDADFIGPEIFDEKNYRSLLENKKIVAIGECGLDYFIIKDKENESEIRNKQKEIFRRQIHLAREYQKPLILHIRSLEKWDAHNDALGILKEVGLSENDKQINGVAHFFTADWSIAQGFLGLDFYISFSGVITFAKQYDDSIINVPLNRILAETDCPYVAPAPFRGKRNEPIFVENVIRRLSEIRGLSFEEMSKVTMENAERLFGINFN